MKNEIRPWGPLGATGSHWELLGGHWWPLGATGGLGSFSEGYKLSEVGALLGRHQLKAAGESCCLGEPPDQTEAPFPTLYHPQI